jgi:microcystin-dependent protein
MVQPYLGEIVLYAFNFAPDRWLECRGAQLKIAQNTGLFTVIGTEFGGDGKSTFALPNYQSISPPGLTYCMALAGVFPPAPRPSAVAETAMLPFRTPQSWLPCNGQVLAIEDFPVLYEAIGNNFGGDGQSTFGLPNLGSTPPTAPTAYAISAGGALAPPSTPFVAEVRLLPYQEAPKGWMLCQGQLLPIVQNQALFSLVGTTFGGNGTTNFALPNLTTSTVPKGMNYCIAVQGVFPTQTPTAT